MSNIRDLIGLEVEHSTAVSFVKPFGTGKIIDVLEDGSIRLVVDFSACMVKTHMKRNKPNNVECNTKEKILEKMMFYKELSNSADGLADNTRKKQPFGVKVFSYPSCLINFLHFTHKVNKEVQDMIDCDLEEYQNKLTKAKADLERVANMQHSKVKTFNYIALKRPYVDGAYSCSKVQMKNNVNSKFTLCQNCDCKNCVSGKMKYEELVDTYNMDGGCAELLIPSNNMVKISKRNKIEQDDVLVFTCIPKDEKEQDRIVYGCAVVQQVRSCADYNEVYLNSDLSYFCDYDSAMDNKFWDVCINTAKPDVMLFGNSHCKKLTAQHMAQYVKMLFKMVDTDEAAQQYLDILSHLGISEGDIEENKGALVYIKSKEQEEEPVIEEEEEADDILKEDLFDDVDED